LKDSAPSPPHYFVLLDHFYLEISDVNSRRFFPPEEIFPEEKTTGGISSGGKTSGGTTGGFF